MGGREERSGEWFLRVGGGEVGVGGRAAAGVQRERGAGRGACRRASCEGDGEDTLTSRRRRVPSPAALSTPPRETALVRPNDVEHSCPSGAREEAEHWHKRLTSPTDQVPQGGPIPRRAPPERRPSCCSRRRRSSAAATDGGCRSTPRCRSRRRPRCWPTPSLWIAPPCAMTTTISPPATRARRQGRRRQRAAGSLATAALRLGPRSRRARRCVATRPHGLRGGAAATAQRRLARLARRTGVAAAVARRRPGRPPRNSPGRSSSRSGWCAP